MKKNLFLNGDFKDAMRDWSLQTVSTLDSNNWVTGTLSAGAAGFTQSSSTTAEALEGRTSGKWAKAAANYQRQGFQSEVLQVDKELQGNVVKFEFSYNLTQVSGTLSLTGVVTTHDIKIAIYDITNSAWIQPSGHMSINSIGIAAIATGEFQLPITTAQVKMFIYQATTSTAAWSIVADSFMLGKVERVYGFSATDPADYVPTFVGFGTVTIGEMKWAKLGKYLHGYGKIVLGTTTGVVASMTLPPGLTSATVNTQAVGYLIYGGTTAAPVKASILAIPNSNLLNFGVINASLSGAFGTSIGASGDVISVEFMLPINGWSSSTVVSSDASTSPVNARYSGTTAQALPAGYVRNIIRYQNKGYDSHDGYNPATGLYTVKVPGTYRIVGLFSISNPVASIDYYIGVNKNGTNFVGFLHPFGVSITLGYVLTLTTEIDCKAGDTLAVFESHGNVTAATLSADSQSFITISLNQGPSTIAASEKIYAKYTSTTGEAIASGTIINYSTKVVDSHNAVTTGTGTWSFKAPRADWYTVSAMYKPALVATNVEYGLVATGGGVASFLQQKRNYLAGNDDQPLSGRTSFYLTTGQTIYVSINGGSVSTLVASASYNWITIESQGGV